MESVIPSRSLCGLGNSTRMCEPIVCVVPSWPFSGPGGVSPACKPIVRRPCVPHAGPNFAWRIKCIACRCVVQKRGPSNPARSAASGVVNGHDAIALRRHFSSSRRSPHPVASLQTVTARWSTMAQIRVPAPMRHRAKSWPPRHRSPEGQVRSTAWLHTSCVNRLSG